ncbi:MAG: PASTA domain-containing protein [Longimicrobiales bacterium]|nr:PASTA domain-containing protein [Longimicrobiales bacterium]
MRLGGSIRRRRGMEKGTGRTLRDILLTLFILAVGGGAGYLLATRVLFPVPEPPEEMTEVPNLHGLTRGEALALARDARLIPMAVDSVSHPTLAAGSVVGQRPVPGQRVLPGDSLRLTMSLGPESRPVPDVYRVRGDRARAVLEATGFTVVPDSVESEYPRGTVLSLEPEPGTEVTLPGEVQMTVSLGPPRVEMPLLLGLEEEEALGRVDSLGLVVAEVSTRFRFGLDQGLVIEQDPDPGTLVERGAPVSIVVGRRGTTFGNITRSESVESPDIIGDSPTPDSQSP